MANLLDTPVKSNHQLSHEFLHKDNNVQFSFTRSQGVWLNCIQLSGVSNVLFIFIYQFKIFETVSVLFYFCTINTTVIAALFHFLFSATATWHMHCCRPRSPTSFRSKWTEMLLCLTHSTQALLYAPNVCPCGIEHDIQRLFFSRCWLKVRNSSIEMTLLQTWMRGGKYRKHIPV